MDACLQTSAQNRGVHIRAANTGIKAALYYAMSSIQIAFI